MAEVSGKQRQQRLNVGALFVPEAKTGHGEPVPEIVRSQRLAVIKAGELADLSESALQAARRQTVASRAEKEGLVLGVGKAASRSRA